MSSMLLELALLVIIAVVHVPHASVRIDVTWLWAMYLFRGYAFFMCALYQLVLPTRAWMYTRHARVWLIDVSRPVSHQDFWRPDDTIIIRFIITNSLSVLGSMMPAFCVRDVKPQALPCVVYDDSQALTHVCTLFGRWLLHHMPIKYGDRSLHTDVHVEASIARCTEEWYNDIF
jgi:hypothetical protein